MKKVDKVKARAKKMAVKAKKDSQKDIAAGYNRFKIFEGQQYTGMTIGRSHKWYYDKGIWKDKKITPDKWEIEYTVKKRRAGKAPEGSGVPVGTEYHWYILAHQFVKKLDANTYSTSLIGHKHKISHKRFDKETWASSEKAQRRKLIKILNELVQSIESNSEEPLEPVKKEKKILAPVKKVRRPLRKKVRIKDRMR
jgi:hypothetical protein